MSSDTIFDRIIRKEIPTELVYEDETVVAFRDISPQAPVHVLVIPKQKITRFADFSSLDPATVGAYMISVAKVAERLGLNQAGYRVVLNNGQDGQQSVDYIHAHILGGRRMTWPPG